MRWHYVMFLLVAVLLVGGAGRLAYIEQTSGERLRSRAAAQETAAISIPAQRGDVLDTRGRVLAGSKRLASIFVDSTLVEDPRFMAHSVAPVLGLEPAAVERLLIERRADAFVWIKRDVSDEQVRAINLVREARRLRAVGVRTEAVRDYPLGRLASHVLGFVGAEGRGLAGVEQSFDAFLAGTPGRRVSTVDAQRRRLRLLEDEYIPPLDGASVVLTLDAYIQERTELHLRAAVEKFKAQWGTAVVLDPRSGEVLAMATCPDFDPSEPIALGLTATQLAAAAERLRNQGVSYAYEPGSIFKPFIVAPALDAGLTRLDEVLAINGPVRLFGTRPVHDTHAYDRLSIAQVISKSSNIGAGLVGARAGNDRIHQWIRAFGFGDPTGVDLPGEHTGLVQDFARWNSYSTQSVPIGQEIAATPIQLAAAFSVFANDGVLYRPRIVRGVVSATGETLIDHSRPIAIRRVLDPSVARAFRLRALVETVRDGTGKNAATLDYQVFGKTGTAQVSIPGQRGYASGKYMGSFVGAAPSDAPRVVVIVSIFMPSSGQYYGGTVAAPAAGAIIGDALEYMQVPPEITAATPRRLPGAESEAAD